MISSKSTQSLPASSFTKQLNEAVYHSLNFEDRQDFEDAQRGLIAPFDFNIFKSDTGEVLWDTDIVEFLRDSAPETVNPSLWRNSQLQSISGLFQVVDGVYQVRGLSISTTVLIEGKNGLIVCDTLKSIESAKAALELYYKHRPKKQVTAIIVSQSHVDHFGGIQAVLEYAENPNIPIIVPQHFTKEAISENVLLGSIMKRRGQYQFGHVLPPGPRGTVCVGIGTIQTNGITTFEMPNVEIENEIQTLDIDGLTFKFLLTPDTEAPAEMHFYCEDYKVLYASENVNKTMHQIYTVRGAKTRDAIQWVSAIEKTIDLVENKEMDALVMAHAWPVWGKENATQHLKLQRDLYKYMHDQTVRLANHGYTMEEIAETIQLPETLNQYWGNRGYYGTLKHNVKGIYNFYLGYYSGHPSDLDPLPQVEAGKKYVQYMGGAAHVIQQAKTDYKNGEYRWVAQVLKHVVMADPDNMEAKHLLADTFEQLGYQAESANWRNMYLVGAMELRNGVNKEVPAYDSSAVFNKVSVDDFLKLLAVKLNGPKANGKKMTVNVTITDTNEEFVLYLENSVLSHKMDVLDDNPDISLHVDKFTLYGMGNGRLAPAQALADRKLEISGEQNKWNEFLSLLDSFNPLVNIVTP
ncbi:alkyl sulfatase BDS1-like metallo-beta-lactamase superfamily hydrolase [Neobacillus bataviensis]|uniref:Alkyl sulfatase BDS1-like metallo-beta-lactamase superfamily hydrolase n=1 Tax=Neobacillus bataviensis TaxID=220685 RepID=A0A561CEL7_9BACI|nr:alkyl sulfatase dimerization domain-containing protein [Neobacillus bataviensis]TWD89616.1 alkyl sulfatase BDS1-like metallo-beta-lactamase superfamily hydrolase [Neobacillus bataviensis]